MLYQFDLKMPHCGYSKGSWLMPMLQRRSRLNEVKVCDIWLSNRYNLFLVCLKNRKMDNKKDGKKLKNVKVGYSVEIVKKQHQSSGELTEGMVKRILTKSASHPHGIKVMIDTGEVGRVKNILD